ncbi:sugar ABC transporter permease [Paenibacillus polymyxa]|jgi:ABC-type sugar transport system permease subunit|uniref:carbohydrate ABC transporter permease n=1 Tax=Paenibacillus TaxID=44249 RepID=UPI0006760FEC|nr:MULTISPECIES: sugar ABC transporter permease [Paenibacillus]KAF6616514.1 sugar ABC transporter permease [Paenibacillus sp. EKM101P]KAF6623812.1 sugar ABC transporter permease [Paenibacillus sp. EKM102P]KAF6633622.1 sugar ABC transporter permease [Paenibacillus sp. EKM10P]KAF6649151.1 sugar ABC transporter permease [Paenibacillus sp. EKM11P]MBY0023311.1 sugar ABC transporter permease [Paenibacillus polymyxa]
MRAPTASTGGRIATATAHLKKKKQHPFAIIFILPSLILYTLFVIVPTLGSVYLSFTSWNGISEDIRFIGFANFVEIWNSPRVHNALKNTLIMTISLVILENIAAIAMALMVDRIRWFKNLFRSIFYFPTLLSGIVMGFVWAMILNYNFGVVNKILDTVGLGSWAVDWLGDPKYAMLSIILSTVWKGAGYYMIIYLAGLQGIPADLSEAASIDGANGWQQFRYITFPLLAGSMTVCMVLSMISALKIFDQIAVMTDGGPGFATETLTYIIYKVGFGELRQGFGTALAMVLFVIILIITVIQVKILRKREVQY